MRHSTRTLTILGNLAIAAALSGCNAEETSTTSSAPVSIPAKTGSPAPPPVRDMKPDETKIGDTKAADIKAADTKAADTKSAETKAADTKAADVKPSLEPPAEAKETAKPKG